MKVGHWKADLKSLQKRYITYYGKDLVLHARKVPDCREVEKRIIYTFKENKISGELLLGSCWKDVIEFIDK